MSSQRLAERSRDAGFTLVEILISIVLVGILAAVAVVGISRLVGDAGGASCQASADAAATASNVYLVNNNVYPTSFLDLTTSVGGASAPLALPAGATISARVIVADRWTLTMSATNPPTFSCATVTAGGSTTTAGPASSSTTSTVASSTTTTSTATTSTATTSTATTSTATTTTGPRVTTALPNGVTAAASVAGDQKFYGENIVMLTNTGVITDLTVTISVVRTPGLTYSGQYTNFWSGAVANSNAATSEFIVYTFTINAGQQIVPGTWKLDAQTIGTGTLHPTSGDMWTATTTSGGLTETRSGTF